jgi:hypothetical protein
LQFHILNAQGLCLQLSAYVYFVLFFLGKCVLVRDKGFNGCGFRMIEKDNYDTPIVIEVRSNSPAKRRY